MLYGNERLSPNYETREQLRRQMTSFERPYPLTSGEPSMEVFMDKFMRSFEQTGMYTPHLQFLEGLPGSGKSFLKDNLIIPYINTFGVEPLVYHWDSAQNKVREIIFQANESISNNKPYQPDFENLILTAYPNDDFDQKAKESLKLSAIKGKPYDEEFLYLTSVKLTTDIKDAASENNTLIIVDKPGATEFPYYNKDTGKREWITARQYGTQTLLHMLSSLPNVHIGFVGVVPGPGVDQKNVLRDLAVGVEARRKGIPLSKITNIPSDTKVSEEGATLEQIGNAKNRAIKAFKDMLDLPLDIQETIAIFDKLPDLLVAFNSNLTENSIPEEILPSIVDGIFACSSAELRKKLEKAKLYAEKTSDISLWAMKSSVESLILAKVLEEVGKAYANDFEMGEYCIIDNDPPISEEELYVIRDIKRANDEYYYRTPKRPTF